MYRTVVLVLVDVWTNFHNHSKLTICSISFVLLCKTDVKVMDHRSQK